ncbi:MAG: hypothetical protein IJX19_11695 [Clostridia bacterium]|nr:hypothetical protein [Clostridia bacterium]
MKKAITILILSAMLSSCLASCNIDNQASSDKELTQALAQDIESTEMPSQEQEKIPTPSVCDPEKDVPAEYRSLIKRFHETLAIRENRELTQEEMETLDQEGFVHLYEHAVNMGQQACFTFHDLNKDGSPELIILTEDGTIYAIYTLKDQTPILVNSYYDCNHIAAIGADGTVYQSGYSKGDTWYFSVTKILNNGETEVFSFGETDYDLYDNVTECYKTVNGEKIVIEKSELDALRASYEDQYAYVYVVPRDTVTKLNTPIYSAKTFEIVKDALADPNQALFDSLKIPEYYRAVLSNRAKLCDIDGYFSYLNQSGELAVVDVDGDVEVEVLVRNGYGTTLLRHYNGIVYGYNFSVQSMYRLNTDGTYYWNTNAGNTYGCNLLRFDGKKRAFEELYRIENDGTECANFFIDNVEVTEKGFQEYTAKQEQKTEVTWHRMESYPKAEADGK